MTFVSTFPYSRDMYIVKQYGDNTAKIIYCRQLREKGWELENEPVKKGSVNTEKLGCNLSRAKSTVRELALCNPWDWWCTFTIDKEKYDRYNLKAYFKDFAEFLHNYNRRCSDTDKVKYLFVPEQHQDGAWHIHGFIKGIRSKDIQTNKNGYLTWKQYADKFGYMSMSAIADKEKASSYVLKYMTKDTEKNVTELHSHLYYASQGLNRATELYRGKGAFFGSWDWEHEEGFCKIKNVNLKEELIEDFLEVNIYDTPTDV